MYGSDFYPYGLSKYKTNTYTHDINNGSDSVSKICVGIQCIHVSVPKYLPIISCSQVYTSLTKGIYIPTSETGLRVGSRVAGPATRTVHRQGSREDTGREPL